MSLHRWFSVVVLATAGIMVEVLAGSVVPPLRPPVAEPRDTTSAQTTPTGPAKTVRPADSLILAVQPEAVEAAVKPVKSLRAEEVLPEDVFGFVSVESLRNLVRDARALKIFGLRNEPIVGDAFVKLQNRVETMFKPGEVDPRSITGMLGAVGLNPEKILSTFTGQVALGVREGSKGTAFYLVMQLPEGREAVHDVAEEFSAQVETKHPGVNVSATLFKDMEVRTFELPDGNIFGYTYLENLMVIGYGKGAIEDLIEKYLDPGARALVSNPAFQSAHGRLWEGALAFYMVDTPKLLRALATAGKLSPPAGAPEEMQKFYKDMRAGNLFNIGLAAGAMFTVNGGVRDRIIIEAANFPFLPGYVPMTVKGELRLKTAVFAPLDAVLYYVAQDFQKLFTQFSASAQGASVSGQLRDIQQKTTIDLAQMISRVFTGEFAVTLTVSAGRPYPDLIIISELQDPDEAMNIISGIKAKLGADVADVAVGSKSRMVYYRPPEKSLLNLFSYSPGVAVDGTFLVFGTSVDAVRRAIRQHRFAGSSSILQSTSFKLATGDLPQSMNTLFFLDVGRAVDLFYNVGLPVLSQLAAQGRPQEGAAALASMPTPESISQHLVPVAVGTRLDEAALHIDAFSPVGTLAVGLLMLSRATDTLGAANITAANAITADNMRRMGLALHQYAADFDRFPLALSELYPTYVEEQGFTPFMSPTGKREVTSREDIDTKSDYVYVPGARLNDLSDTIIAYTKSYVHNNNTRTVLLLDNSVKNISEAEFRAMMARQGTAVASE